MYFSLSGIVVLPRLAMASADLPLIMRDHLYSLDDRLKRGRPPCTSEDIFIDREPMPETTPVVDPASISRCCIERGLFLAVPLFFQYPCGTSKGWLEWVDHELQDPSACDILNQAGVLDAIFISKACEIHIKPKILQHVVSQDPFHIALTLEGKLKLEVLRKGAPTSPSTSPWFSNLIQFFRDVNRNEPCRLAVFISLWLGRFLLCDFPPDCLHERVFPLALAIARGSVLPLAPMFLRHLYCLLDQVQLLEKGAARTMVVETFLNSSFLQVFLWKLFKGIEVSPLPYSKAKTLVYSHEASYVPEGLPLICRWSQRIQRKDQNFLGLLDDVANFIFPHGHQLRREALLSTTFLPLPTLGDDHLEVSVHYSPHRVRRQIGFDQGMPSSPSHGDPASLHRVFWTRDNLLEDGRPLALALADKERAGDLSKAYQSYWNRCFASFSRFHVAHCDRLLPTIIPHARLVFGSWRNRVLTAPGRVLHTEKESGRKAAVLRRRDKLSMQVGEVSEALPSHSTPRIKSKGKETVVIPKRQSMCILQTRFSGTCKGKGENSGSKVVVIVDDDDDGSDEYAAIEIGISTYEQESIHGQVAWMRTSIRTKITVVMKALTWRSRMPQTYLPNLLVTMSGMLTLNRLFPSLRTRQVAHQRLALAFLLLLLTLRRLLARSRASHKGRKIRFLTLPLGTPDAVVDTAMRLPATQPPAPPILGTSDIADSTSPQVPTVLPPTPPFPGTSDTAAGLHSFQQCRLVDWENSFTTFKAFFEGVSQFLGLSTNFFHFAIGSMECCLPSSQLGASWDRYHGAP
ncbi:unnamed protein product [Prunus armeniaca]